MPEIKRSPTTPNKVTVEIETYDSGWQTAQWMIEKIREANINCTLRVEVKDVLD